MIPFLLIFRVFKSDDNPHQSKKQLLYPGLQPASRELPKYKPVSRGEALTGCEKGIKPIRNILI